MRVIVDKEKLKSLIAERGYRNYEQVAIQAREDGRSLSPTTFYYFLENSSNWTRETLETICTLLKCHPLDFLIFEQD